MFLSYELPRRGIERTIAFKVQYVPGSDDLVTVWLDPELGPGVTEGELPEALTTRFRADASFDQLRLRHGGGGGGWVFSDMAVATSFTDFVPGTEGRLAAASPAQAYSFRAWQQNKGCHKTSFAPCYKPAMVTFGSALMMVSRGLMVFVLFLLAGVRVCERGRSAPFSRITKALCGWAAWAAASCAKEAAPLPTLHRTTVCHRTSYRRWQTDGASNLWAGTSSGLARLVNGRWHALTNHAEAARPVTALFKDSRGSLWAGLSGAGIFLVTNGTLVRFDDPSVEPLLRDPHSLLVDHQGNLWVGAGDDFLLCRQQTEWRRYRIPRHLTRPYISSLTGGRTARSGLVL